MIQIPQKAYIGKRIPKNRFTGKLRQKLFEPIEDIIWKYKLSPDSINIGESDKLSEIQIIEIRLKEKLNRTDFLSPIDKSIPYPILFIMKFDEQSRLLMAFKESSPNLYFSTEWSAETSLSLPYALTLSQLYHEFLFLLIPLGRKENESIEAIVARYKELVRLENEKTKLQSAVDNEKQPNIRVKLNGDLTVLKKQILLLKD